MSEKKPTEAKVDSTLSKGLAILEKLAEARRSLGVTEISRALDLTKSNTFRLLQTALQTWLCRTAGRRQLRGNAENVASRTLHGRQSQPERTRGS